MQISPTSVLLNALSSLPAQAGSATQTPAGPATPSAAAAPSQPPAIAAAAKALAAREAASQAAPPPAPAGVPPSRNMPRGSVVNIVV